MPTVSLRLTEEELQKLHAWAHDSRRSLQKEIVWRLFSTAHVPTTSGAGPRILADAEPRIPTRTIDPHFKPDPK